MFTRNTEWVPDQDQPVRLAAGVVDEAGWHAVSPIIEELRFCIFQAAENKGVRKVIYISTDSVLGFYWKTRDFGPEYFPLT